MLSPHTVVPAAAPVARPATAGAQLPYPLCALEVITVDVRAVTVGVNDSRCAVTQGADRANYREAVIPAAHVDDGRLAQVAHSRMIAALLRVHEPIFATRTDVDVDALICRMWCDFLTIGDVGRMLRTATRNLGFGSPQALRTQVLAQFKM